MGKKDSELHEVWNDFCRKFEEAATGARLTLITLTSSEYLAIARDLSLIGARLNKNEELILELKTREKKIRTVKIRTKHLRIDADTRTLRFKENGFPGAMLMDGSLTEKRRQNWEILAALLEQTV